MLIVQVGVIVLRAGGDMDLGSIFHHSLQLSVSWILERARLNVNLK